MVVFLFVRRLPRPGLEVETPVIRTFRTGVFKVFVRVMGSSLWSLMKKPGSDEKRSQLADRGGFDVVFHVRVIAGLHGGPSTCESGSFVRPQARTVTPVLEPDTPS